jgi:hypothetical protein
MTQGEASARPSAGSARAAIGKTSAADSAPHAMKFRTERIESTPLSNTNKTGLHLISRSH